MQSVQSMSMQSVQSVAVPFLRAAECGHYVALVCVHVQI